MKICEKLNNLLNSDTNGKLCYNGLKGDAWKLIDRPLNGCEKSARNLTKTQNTVRELLENSKKRSHILISETNQILNYLLILQKNDLKKLSNKLKSDNPIKPYDELDTLIKEVLKSSPAIKVKAIGTAFNNKLQSYPVFYKIKKRRPKIEMVRLGC